MTMDFTFFLYVHCITTCLSILWAYFCHTPPSLVFVAVIKYCDHNQPGDRMSLFYLTGYSPSLRKVRVEIQSRDHWRTLLIGLLSSLIEPRIASPYWLGAFYISQENALTNTLAHSQAQLMEATLQLRPLLPMCVKMTTKICHQTSLLSPFLPLFLVSFVPLDS